MHKHVLMKWRITLEPNKKDPLTMVGKLYYQQNLVDTYQFYNGRKHIAANLKAMVDRIFEAESNIE